MLSYIQSFWSIPKAVKIDSSPLPEKTSPKNPEAMAILDLLLGDEPEEPEEKEKYFRYSSNIVDFLSTCGLYHNVIDIELDGWQQPLNLWNDGESTTLDLDGEEVVLMDTSLEQLLDMFRSNIVNMPVSPFMVDPDEEN